MIFQLAALLIAFQANAFYVEMYDGTCAANGNLLEKGFYETEPGNCWTIAPGFNGLPYSLNGANVLAFQDNCASTGSITYFANGECTNAVYTSADLTCLKSTNAEQYPSTIKFACFPPPGNCKPSTGLDIKACNRKIRQCGEAAPMRWTGKGCRVRGVIMNDAGCQCAEYCGFNCKSACTSKLNKKYCAWSQGKCSNKVTGATGPIPNCELEYEGAGKAQPRKDWPRSS